MSPGDVLRRQAAATLLACALVPGCARSFWTTDIELQEAERLVVTNPADTVALPVSSRPGPTKEATTEPTYLRYSMLTVLRPTVRPPGAPVEVRTPNKRRKYIAGLVLLSIGTGLVVGGIAQVAYGVRTDDLGIIAGLAGLPLVIGTSLVIPGALLVKRNLPPFDILRRGAPGMLRVAVPAPPK